MELDVDPAAEAGLPAGSRVLLNEDGLAPGCVIEDVYIFPGIPGELKAMFTEVASEFSGEKRTQLLYTTEPEANIIPQLEAVMSAFDVTVGCYPDRDAGHNRLKITATNDEQLTEATAWLHERVSASHTPVSRDERHQ